MEEKLIKIAQVNGYIKKLLEQNIHLQKISIEGELSNFTHHYKSGHLYFSLKDDTSVLKGVMFQRDAKLLNFEPENGMKVLIRGAIKVYEANGTYQIVGREMLPFGEGSYQLAFDQLKAKLEKKGYFALEHKKPIPKNIEKIGIITALDGAALQDFISVIERRNPMMKIVVFPSIMQGTQCQDSVIKGLEQAQKTDCDILIIARGGGAVEDLWQFNGESLAQAIYQSKKVIISAIGHEVDFTISDFVADIRAATPSVAAELVSNVISVMDIQDKEKKIRRKIQYMLQENIQNMALFQKQLSYFTPSLTLSQYEKHIFELEIRIKREVYNIIDKKELGLVNNIQKLGQVNLSSILQRGYGIAQIGEKTVKSVEELKVGSKYQLLLSDGIVESTVERIIRG